MTDCDVIDSATGRAYKLYNIPAIPKSFPLVVGVPGLTRVRREKLAA